MSTKPGRQSTEGYTHGSRLNGRGARNWNQMVTDAETVIQTGSGRQVDVIPYVLCLWWIILIMSDLWVEMSRLSLGFISGCRLGDSCPSLYTLAGRVTRKVFQSAIWQVFYLDYNAYKSPSKSYLLDILRCTPTSTVRRAS